MRVVAMFAFALCASTTAHADATMCFPKGKPILTREHLDMTAKTLTTTKVFANSAYSLETRKVDDPKSIAMAGGCVLAATTKKVKALSKGVPWKKSTSGVACDAVSTWRTKYWIEAKLVWTAEVCGPEVLDEKSTKRIGEIWTALDAEITHPTTPTPPTPPAKPAPPAPPAKP